MPVSKGTKLEKVVEMFRGADSGAGLVVLMRQSRFDKGNTGNLYEYQFDLTVLDRNGKILAQKSFQRRDPNIEINPRHLWPDTFTEIYKNIFQEFLNDPEISRALAAST